MSTDFSDDFSTKCMWSDPSLTVEKQNSLNPLATSKQIRWFIIHLPFQPDELTVSSYWCEYISYCISSENFITDTYQATPTWWSVIFIIFEEREAYWKDEGFKKEKEWTYRRN